MEAHDRELAEIEPCGVKKVAPIVHESVNDHAAVQLRAQCIEDLALVNGQGFEGTLRNLEGMRALEDRHGRVYDRVKRHLETSDLNNDKWARDERHLVRRFGKYCHGSCRGS